MNRVIIQQRNTKYHIENYITPGQIHQTYIFLNE